MVHWTDSHKSQRSIFNYVFNLTALIVQILVTRKFQEIRKFEIF